MASKWLGSWYFREGKSGPTSWRNRNTGEIVKMRKDVSKNDLNKSKTIGYEPTGANPYGTHPVTKQRAKEDLMRFKTKR